MAPLESRHTQVGFNLISVQVCFAYLAGFRGRVGDIEGGSLTQPMAEQVPDSQTSSSQSRGIPCHSNPAYQQE